MSFTGIPSSPESGEFSWKTERNSHSTDLNKIAVNDLNPRH